MDLSEESQKVFQELQVLEHNMNNLLAQRQAFQLELNETSNAIEEVKKNKDDIYRIVGSIMVKAEKEKTLKELEEKKKLLELRNESLSKQEKIYEKKAKELQEILKKEIEAKSKK